MMCPEKGAPERLYGAYGLKDLAGHGRVSEKEFLSGRKRAAAKPRPGTRTALSMRVSTADQKPDLQDDDLRGYAARAGLNVVQDYCDVAVSGRREGRPPAQCPDGSRPEPRDRLRAGLDIRSLCSQHAPPADGARGVRPPRRAICQRPGSDRHR